MPTVPSLLKSALGKLVFHLDSSVDRSITLTTLSPLVSPGLVVGGVVMVQVWVVGVVSVLFELSVALTVKVWLPMLRPV